MSPNQPEKSASREISTKTQVSGKTLKFSNKFNASVEKSIYQSIECNKLSLQQKAVFSIQTHCDFFNAYQVEKPHMSLKTVREES